MAKAKIIGAVIAAVVAVIIIIQNTAEVETRILFITLTMPRAVLLALTFVIGIVTGLLFALDLKWKHKKDA